MWKEAYDFNNYLCNEKGEIYSLLSAKIMKTHNDKDGYQCLRMTVEKGKAVTVKAHRLIAQTFLPNPENKQYVNHKDGNKKNNAVYRGKSVQNTAFEELYRNDKSAFYLPWEYLPQSHGGIYTEGPGPSGGAGGGV